MKEEKNNSKRKTLNYIIIINLSEEKCAERKRTSDPVNKIEKTKLHKYQISIINYQLSRTWLNE